MSESDTVLDQQETTEVPVTDESEKLNTEGNNEEQQKETQVETEPSETNDVKENQPEETVEQPTQESEVENQSEEPKEEVKEDSQPESVKEEPVQEDSSVVVAKSQPVVSEEVKEEPAKEETKVEVKEEVKEPARELKEYTLEEVARHDKPEDCWIIINNKVYDVTPFIAQHPGGVAILRNAGKDSTDGFEKIGAHKKKASDDDELSKARNWMSSFLIGTVKPSEAVEEKAEVDPEDILAQCLAEAEEKVKVETAIAQPTRVEPTVVKPAVVQPTTSTTTATVKPAVTTSSVQQPKAQSTTQPTTTSSTATKATVTPSKKGQSSESSYTTWILVAGGVAVTAAAVGAYAYFSKKQQI
jgi:cytochrome b involved in lipid metabolism